MTEAANRGYACLPRISAGCLVLLLFIVPVSALADDNTGLAQGIDSETRELRKVGSGELRWFGLRIYEAELWTADGTWTSDTRPFALVLDYRRNISGQRLVETTVEQIKRLGTADNDLRAWKQELAELFPDVQPGDRITGIATDNDHARFLHNDRLLGEIRDPHFTEAFFAIWLDEQTREPDLRAALIGDPR